MANNTDPFRHFGTPTPTNAARIDDKIWEKHKLHIIDLYHTQKLTLAKTMEDMLKQHDFNATKRQYVHRLALWGVGKYKKTKEKKQIAGSQRCSSTVTLPAESPSYRPQLANRNQNCNDECHYLRVFADSLSALGDNQSAFKIYHALYRRRPESALAIQCARTANTDKQAAEARQMLQDNIEVLSAPKGQPGTNYFFEVVLARLFDHGADEPMALMQIEQLLDQGTGILEKDAHGRLKLRKLPCRDNCPAFDLPAYRYLHYALQRFNDFSYEEDGAYNPTEDDDVIDIDSILDDFELQQPVFTQGIDVSCVRACLIWCIDMLGRDPAIPDMELRLPVSNQDDEVMSTYQILCTLWHIWLGPSGSPFPHYHSSHPRNDQPALSSIWAGKVEEQLGISSSELLAIVVYMIMDTPAYSPRRETVAGLTVVKRALAQAETLNRKATETIFDTFLAKAYEISRHPSADADDEDGPYDAAMPFHQLQQRRQEQRALQYSIKMGKLEPFRVFVARYLELLLPTATDDDDYRFLIRRW
ncbi:hypothetical protein QBC46DRAFT_412247 [Diplogelasinospora grovesii]|uniref:Clr5 domain-containing protein n=1 Tax=Diplogelasinospora grovesii TaxID=303347 RepID=A0AAN6N0U6_9PEZI|nr:hypothetical protein QBC46DRAFT_412247 [Diplogelasinospora grovesii]